MKANNDAPAQEVTVQEKKIIQSLQEQEKELEKKIAEIKEKVAIES